MSIYATRWEIKVPRQHCFDEEWVRVFAQGVPAHIGHPSHYPEGDPYGDFLPPAVGDYDPTTDEARYARAVVIVQEGRDKKEGQRYLDPLLVLTGEEYARLTFDELLRRICQAIGWDESVGTMWITKDGKKKIIRTGVDGRREICDME